MLSLSPWFLTLFVVVFTIVSVLSYTKMHAANRKGWRVLLTLRLLLFSVVLLIFADITLPHITKLKKLPQVSIFFDNSVSAAHHPSMMFRLSCIHSVLKSENCNQFRKILTSRSRQLISIRLWIMIHIWLQIDMSQELF